MKKIIITLIFILALGLGIYGEPTDLVLLLDTSASMSASYRETSDYLIGPFLREFLRIGDTFHLISFSGTPRLEISRRVEGIGDVEAIIGRLLLMYPLEPESNITDALSFAENFASSLSGTKPKKIVLISDGSTDADAPDTQNLIDQASERFRRLGAELQYIKSPVTGTGPSSGRPPEYISSPATTVPPATTTPPPVTTTTPPVTTTTPPATTTQPPITASPPATTTTPPATTAQPPATTSTTPPATTAQPPAPTSTPPPVTTAQPPATTTTTPPATTAEPPATTTTTPPATTAQPPATTTTTPPATTAQPPATTTTTPPATTATPPVTTTTPQSNTTITPQGQTQTGESSSRTGYGISLRLLILILLNLLVLGLIVYFVVKNLHKSPDRAVARAAYPQDKKTGQSSGILTDSKNTGGIYTNSNSETRKPQASPPVSSPPKTSPQPVSSPPMASPQPVSSPPKTSPQPVSSPPKASPHPVSSPLKASTYPEPSPPKRKPLPKDKDYKESSEESLMLNLFVEDQNTAIGRRNIHSVKAGNKFTIGGGKSDFLIFLVSIPPNIADLQYDGRNCTLTPRKPVYFPDLGSQQVPACIGKNIRVVSDRNYELHIRIDKYEDPLKALNRLMNSISVPGERRE